MQLIVGLNNPGPDYRDTRHNAGAWLCEAWARKRGVSFVFDKKFQGEWGRVSSQTLSSSLQASQDYYILFPQTFMNLNGLSVQALMQFYKIPVEHVLVVHDDLDLPPGTVRLKFGGGHGGHNGLRDIIQRLGANFWRLRVGIGHPGSPDRVTGFVLGCPLGAEREAIDAGILKALDVMDDILIGDPAHMNKAMQALHTPSST